MAISSTGTNYFWFFVITSVTTVLFGAMTFYLVNKLKKIQEYAGLVEVMAECKNGTMGIIVDKGSKIIPISIEHNPKNAGLAVHKRYTLIHPDLAKPNTKHRIKGGPEMSFYPLPGYFPYSIQSAAALVQLARDLKEDERFSWITDELGLIALMFNATESFPRDAKQLVQDCVNFGDEIPNNYFGNDEEEEAEEDEYTDDMAEEEGETEELYEDDIEEDNEQDDFTEEEK